MRSWRARELIDSPLVPAEALGEVGTGKIEDAGEMFTTGEARGQGRGSRRKGFSTNGRGQREGRRM